MNRTDLPHLVQSLESLAAGQVVSRIVVDAKARLALVRMLCLN